MVKVYKSIDLINAESTEGLTSVVKSFDLSSFQSIDTGVLKVQLHADDPLLPILHEWKLTKFVVNDKSFTPSHERIATNVVHNNNAQGLQGVLKQDKNRVTISWIAPFGAGVITPHSRISAQLQVSGEEFIPIPKELSTLNLENITNNTENFVNKATLPTIAILIIVMLIALFTFLALSRGSVIASTVSEVS